MENIIWNYHKLELVNPGFESKLVDLIIQLDYLRKQKITGSTPDTLFLQLKNIFHTVESLASARIEGNHTTLSEIIENKNADKLSDDEKIREITNIEMALNFIDENIPFAFFNRILISELHKMTVDGLKKEGSKTPGDYRKKNPVISGAKYKPPDFSRVPDLMDELLEFINNNDDPKYDLLKTAISHHRFVWIHPFDNGNGRTVRLLTYAMLVKQGFKINVGSRILNPTAIFCNDRNKYYEALSAADAGEKEGLLSWCEYVLEGLKIEIEKIDRLLDYDYLSKNFFLPIINEANEKNIITAGDLDVLKVVINKKIIMAKDIKTLFPGKLPQDISRRIAKLKKSKLIIPESNDSRKYSFSLENKYVYRSIIEKLADNGFLPVKE